MFTCPCAAKTRVHLLSPTSHLLYFPFALLRFSMESSDTTTISSSSSSPRSLSPSLSSPPAPPLPPPAAAAAAAAGPVVVVVSPCAACKILRRRCAEKCVLAPYFPPTEPLKFTIAHRVFGASNIIKFLQELPESQRADAVSSMVYEANARLRDPVYGCAGAIFQLQKQVNELQAQLAKSQAELVNMQCHHANLMALLCMEMAQSQSHQQQQQQPPQPQQSVNNLINTTPYSYQNINSSGFLEDYNNNNNNIVGSLWELPLWT